MIGYLSVPVFITICVFVFAFMWLVFAILAEAQEKRQAWDQLNERSEAEMKGGAVKSQEAAPSASHHTDEHEQMARLDTIDLDEFLRRVAGA